MPINEVTSDKTFTEKINDVDITIGNDKVSSEFQAHVKMRFWDEDEIWFERPGVKGTPLLANDIISLDSANEKSEWYRDNKTLKWVTTFKTKPATKKIVYNLGGNWQDFNFWKQPVWPAPIETYYENGVEWQRKYNYNSWQMVQREKRVEGSYSVRHKTKKGDYAGGKQYKTGKVNHIYPSIAVDADGKTALCELDVIAGQLIETIPQAFLDTAKYPVRCNTDFGSTYAGGNNGNHNGGQCRVAGPYSPPSDCDAASITMRFNHVGTDVDFITGIYADNTGIDGGALLRDGVGETITAKIIDNFLRGWLGLKCCYPL